MDRNETNRQEGITMNRIGTALLLVTLCSIGTTSLSLAQDGATQAAQFHAAYSELLQKHVHGVQVDYLAWASDWDDLEGLRNYVDELSSLDPEGWPQFDGMAYWINMYNAITVLLILDHYPVESIKKIGGAWKDDRVQVAGEELSLNAIENEILRPMTQDARIHFAINCASVGCPPLRSEAYLADGLEEQLEDSTHRSLQLETQLAVVGDTVLLSKIFGWYGEDFEADAGSVEEFIQRYREDLPSGDYKTQTMDYDWSLNDTGTSN